MLDVLADRFGLCLVCRSKIDANTLACNRIEANAVPLAVLLNVRHLLEPPQQLVAADQQPAAAFLGDKFATVDRLANARYGNATSLSSLRDRIGNRVREASRTQDIENCTLDRASQIVTHKKGSRGKHRVIRACQVVCDCHHSEPEG